MGWRTVVPRHTLALGADPSPRAASRDARVASRTPTDPTAAQDQWFEWRGHRIAYSRRGMGGPPLLLVHGVRTGASSAEWRRVVDGLANERTVYTIDLLGFGRSARPRAIYGARLYQALLADFATHVVREPVVLVAAERSAAYAIALAARDPGRFPALIVVGPTGLIRAIGEPAPWARARRALFAIPWLGTMVYHASVSRAAIRRWLERAYADYDLVTDADVEARYASAREPGAKWAACALDAGRLDLDVRSAMRHLPQPMLIAWGARAAHVPFDEMLGFRALKHDARIASIELAGDLPHVERPGELLAVALDFLASVRCTIGTSAARPEAVA